MFVRRRSLKRGAAVVWFLLLALAAGCATVRDDDRQSDLPWSEPKPWEGVIPMPGFDNR